MDVEEFDPYLRKSNKDMSRSVQRQHADLKDGAEDQGIRLSDRMFVDPDLSASRFAKKERPDYQALLAHIESGQCVGIAMVEASRGSRDLPEWSRFLALCRTKKVKIWVSTHARVYDLKRRQDWRVLADEGVNAADESERLSERVTSGKRKAAKEGKPAGPLVYGYVRRYDEAGKLASVQPHETQAPIVKELVDRVAKGDALYAIAADLNARGIPRPRRGKAWSTATVRTIVMSPAYVGKRVHLGGVIGPAMWPAIVDEAKQRKAIGILTRPERRTTTRGTALAHWLSSVALCGACGAHRLRSGGGGKYSCRGCFGVRIQIEPFEQLIERAVLDRLADPVVATVWTPRENTEALTAATADLDDLRTTLQAYYRKGALRQMTPEGVTAIEADMLPLIKAAETRVKILSTPSVIANLGTPAEIIKKWSTYPPAAKRTVVKYLAEIVVMPTQHRGGNILNPRRLDHSRWLGDTLTWGELYERAEATATPDQL